MSELVDKNDLKDESSCCLSGPIDKLLPHSCTQPKTLKKEQKPPTCRLSITADRPEYLKSVKPKVVEVSQFKKPNCDSEQDISLEALLTLESAAEEPPVKTLPPSKQLSDELCQKQKLQKQVSFSQRVELTIKDFNSQNNNNTVKIFVPMTGLDDKDSSSGSNYRKRLRFKKRSETF